GSSPARLAVVPAIRISHEWCDLRADPCELKNRDKDEAARDTLQELRAEVDRLLRETDGKRVSRRERLDGPGTYGTLGRAIPLPSGGFRCLSPPRSHIDVVG